MTGKTRVLMLCSGVGRLGRGIETFFADAHAGLKDDPELDIVLAVGAGAPAKGQERIISLSRTGRIATTLGKVFGRDAYIVEQLTSIPSVLAKIRRFEPQVVFSSEANLIMRLMKYRNVTGAPYRLLYSNGAPMRGPFPWADFVHQVTPTLCDLALHDGDEKFRHIFIPYGFTVPGKPPDRSTDRRRAARRHLGLAEGRPIILTVGLIGQRHKRMTYVVDEVAKLPEPRPVLAMVGAMSGESSHIISDARFKLGEQGILARCVRPSEVPLWYAAADVFVLASLSEGFGRVYVEALGAGVPVFSHDYPISRFVNGGHAVYGDFSKPGGLSSLLATHPDLFDEDFEADRSRWAYARDNFGWPALSPKYRAMFHAASIGPRRGEATYITKVRQVLPADASNPPTQEGHV